MLDYILQYERDQYKEIGSSYRMKEHPSFAVSNKGFYWHGQKFGSVTALDYLVMVRNMDFVSAVCQLINEAPYEKGNKSNQQKQGRPPPKPTPKASLPSSENKIKQRPILQYLSLPRRNKDHYQVISYLQNRGIDRDVIMDCISRGVLYESILHHNAVFLGKDENGKTKFAAMRGTKGDFKCDAEGSDKKYGFMIPPQNLESQTVMLFESPIDCLSHQTLCKRGYISDFDGWRLSLGGTASVAALHFLEQHPKINHCFIATDNDDAGNKIAETLTEEISIPTERVLPIHSNDWNDALVDVLQSERNKRRTNEFSL